MVVVATRKQPKGDTPSEARTRTTRSTDDRVAELEAKIARLRERELNKKVKADPVARHVKAAVKSVDKAIDSTKDNATSGALDEARAVMAGVLNKLGVPSVNGGGRKPKATSEIAADDILEYISTHDGQRTEEIAEGLQTDSAGLRKGLSALKADGRVRAEGKARATRYFLSEE